MVPFRGGMNNSWTWITRIADPGMAFMVKFLLGQTRVRISSNIIGLEPKEVRWGGNPAPPENWWVKANTTFPVRLGRNKEKVKESGRVVKLKVAPQSWLSRIMEIVNLGNVTFASKGLWVPIKNIWCLLSFFRGLNVGNREDHLVDSTLVHPGHHPDRPDDREFRYHQAH